MNSLKSTHTIKATVFALLTLLIISCNGNQKNSLKLSEGDKADSINSNNDSTDETLATTDTTTILLPTTYRLFSGEIDPTEKLTKEWFSLIGVAGNYYLEHAEFTITKGFDECAAVDTKEIKTDSNTVIIINNRKLAVGQINRLNIVEPYIWPNETTKLIFNHQTYSLRAEGEILDTTNITRNDSTKSEVWHNVKNYKLYIKSTNSQEELIISEEAFEDTFVKLEFAGDIDRDGKLDFIFDSSRNYEEKRVLMFLSTEAKPENNVGKAIEIAIQFDC